MSKTIFVTVGTTRFDSLMEHVTTMEALNWMKKNGYTHLILQHGKGPRPVVSSKACPVKLDCFDFANSLDMYMDKADLIVSHAGAGTVMEALRKHNKRLVVVINTSLMHNHQMELANAMGKRGHLFVIERPTDLQSMELWNDFDSFIPIPFPSNSTEEEKEFPKILNRHMGIPSSSKTTAGTTTATSNKSS